MQIELLTEGQVGALLSRLGVSAGPPGIDTLSRVQRAWILAEPFHNVDVLAAGARRSGALSPGEAVSRCIAGLGGPCHVQSVALLLLLRSLGFEAHLCGAAVSHPDDHLVVLVTVDGRRFFCDVGNGQPFLRPFPADREARQSHLGWIVWSRPDGEGLVVERASQDQPARRVVYRASPAPRAWSDFERTIARHHAEPGFGPFLTGLRVVRIGETEMVTLRDDVRTIYREGEHERRTLAPDEIAPFVRDELRLGELPVDEAVRAFLVATGRA